MPATDHNIQACYSRLGITQLNEMQTAALKSAAAHNQILLLSPTGSGKTLAFLLPLIERMADTPRILQSVIITPSRELALQIADVFKKMQTGWKVTLAYGGHKREIEENDLIDAPGVLIGTPGRICDHIRRQNIDVNTVMNLVIDEYDKCLETGFSEEIAFIAQSLSHRSFTMLCSATRATALPAWLTIQPSTTLDFLPEEESDSAKLDYKVLYYNEEAQLPALLGLTGLVGGRPSVIFCNYKETVETVSEYLTQNGVPNVYYHGSIEQRDRERNLAKFRNGSVYFLVTTDLASRGLDIPYLRYVIHYQMPDTAESFTHRNGRTARMDASGTILMLAPQGKPLKSYFSYEYQEIKLPEQYELPEKPKWTTLYIGAGKKNKINKIDIVGFLCKKGDLKSEELGLIEVKDYWSFVGVRKSKASYVLNSIKNEKLKGKKIIIEPAK